jgi:hypothetical protein
MAEVEEAEAVVEVGVVVCIAVLVWSPGPSVTRAVMVVEGRVMICVTTGFWRAARASASDPTPAARKRRICLWLMIAI